VRRGSLLMVRFRLAALVARLMFRRAAARCLDVAMPVSSEARRVARETVPP